VLGTEAGAAYVATTMRKRLTRTGHTVHGLLDVGTTPVSAIMRPPAFFEGDLPLREAAARLGEDGVSALLVELGEGQLGIVTDASVRAAVADGTSIESPARAISRNARADGARRTARGGGNRRSARRGNRPPRRARRQQHLWAPVGGGSARARCPEPIALRHTILGAADEDGLVRAAEHLPQLFRLLVRAGVPPRDVGRVLSLQHDAIVTRLVDFSISRHGDTPVPWVWLDLGSAARREFTLASDQDNALAYATPSSEGEAIEVDAYFERLGSEVNAGLVRCGIGVDNNGVLAGKRLWRMSKSEWMRTFDECLTQPDESHLIRASVAFDFRPAAGGLTIAPELTARIRAAPQHPQFMRLLARAAAGFQVSLGFRGQLATGRQGEPADRLDLKHGAIIPLVNLVRFHALAHRVTISPTLDRIEAVASVGGIERETADALSEAFSVITRLRFANHAEQIAAGTTPRQPGRPR